jgi:hypothetical protein
MICFTLNKSNKAIYFVNPTIINFWILISMLNLIYYFFVKYIFLKIEWMYDGIKRLKLLYKDRIMWQSKDHRFANLGKSFLVLYLHRILLSILVGWPFNEFQYRFSIKNSLDLKNCLLNQLRLQFKGLKTRGKFYWKPPLHSLSIVKPVLSDDDSF